MAKTQSKRVSKTSNGTARGARKSPMTPLFLVLNNKGFYRSMQGQQKKK